jgi:formamidopyrimidine-DNA glycosylase
VPELPEVETVVRDLRLVLIGRSMTSIRRDRKALRRPWKKEWETLLHGARVESIRRRGKWILLDLDRDRHVVIHLGMSGQLTTTEAVTPEEDHTHLIVALDDGRQLRFRDIRRFGSVTFFPDNPALAAFIEKTNLGPEPWDLERKAWHARLTATMRVLKAVLLDQRMVAGVGNIYADESLFLARLHPSRIGKLLKPAESERLRSSILLVLNQAIARRGSTIRDYVGGSGLQGGYQDEFRVYGRTGQPCVRCQTLIQRLRLAGRSTHYCPSCQPSAVSSQRLTKC